MGPNSSGHGRCRADPAGAIKRVVRSSLLGRLSAVALGLIACSGARGSNQDYGVVQSSISRDTSPKVASSDLQPLVSGNTTFAFDLYHQIAADNATDNLFYSPYSVSIALAMTYAGAGSSTATQMATALDFQLPASALNPAFDALDLQLASRAQGQAGDDGQPFKLNVVDALWADKTFTFQKPFLDTLARYYGAGLRTVDFENAPEMARGAINGWVSDQTEKLIPQLLPHGTIDSGTRFVIVNAIYFNAGWESPFMPSSTRPSAFTHLDGSTAQVPMMNQSPRDGLRLRLELAGDRAAIRRGADVDGHRLAAAGAIPRGGARARRELRIVGLLGAPDHARSLSRCPSSRSRARPSVWQGSSETLGMIDAFDPRRRTSRR